MIKIKLDKPIDANIRLKARKTITGDIMILDHPDIDVVVSTNENRVLCFPKKEYGDNIYALQARLFDYLVKKGSIVNGSVRASNIYGSLQGTMLSDIIQQPVVDPTQVAIYLIAKFLRDELHVGDIVDDYQDAYDDLLTEPPKDDTTQLGKVPHGPHKGVNYYGQNSVYGMYGQMYEE